MIDRTKTLLAAYRTLKTTFFTIYHLPDDLIPMKDYNEWISRRGEVIEEICYDIYDKILTLCIEDNKMGRLSRDEQRMLAKTIQMIAAELDYCPHPWDSEYREEKNFARTLEQLNNSRQDLIKLIDTLDVKTIKQFTNKAGDFIKYIAPETQFFDYRIILNIKLPQKHGNKVFEMTILEDDGRLLVSPIVYGPFYSYMGYKKVNIETGEVLNKVKYDLHNHTIDLTSFD